MAERNSSELTQQDSEIARSAQAHKRAEMFEGRTAVLLMTISLSHLISNLMIKVRIPEVRKEELSEVLNTFLQQHRDSPMDIRWASSSNVTIGGICKSAEILFSCLSTIPGLLEKLRPLMEVPESSYMKSRKKAKETTTGKSSAPQSLSHLNN